MRPGDLLRSIALLCFGYVVGCTGSGGRVVPIEVNLNIVHPNGSSTDLGFSIDRVDYRITCPGNVPGSYPIPPADSTGTLYSFDDSVDMSGAFEVVDTRTPPVWQAAMALPPGNCTITLLVYDIDEVVCVGSQSLTIVENVTSKFDIVLVCSLSVDLPDGALNVSTSVEIVIGNTCPQLHSLMAIPRTVNIATNPPRTRIEYRSMDLDGTCGSNCKPESCTNSIPPVCTPAVYNPADPRCNPSFGGNPLSAACVDGTASGLVCTVTATPSATAVPGGDFVSPQDGVSLVGPSVAVNLDDFAANGTGVAVPGVDLYYECDPSIPGSVSIDLVCGDGDPLCNRVETITVICPGQNFCDSNPIDCSAPSECTAGGLCDAFCDPANLANCSSPGNRCPGRGDALPINTACSTGGNVCDGAGNCVECNDNAICDSSPVDCREPSQCVGKVCQPRAVSPDGAPCSNGECQGGVCVLVPCDPCEESCGQTGGPGFDPISCSGPIALACTNNITTDTSILQWVLQANPGTIIAGAPVTVDYSATAVFSEALLDAGLTAVPGFSLAEIIAGVGTVQVRQGLSGPDVALAAVSLPTTCGGGANVGLPCTPGNEAVDCPPGLPFGKCGQFVPIPKVHGVPNSAGGCTRSGGGVPDCDCSACAVLGAAKAAQCLVNGYCVAPGGLSVELEPASQSYTVGASGAVRIGWADQGTGASLNPNGTYTLPPAVFVNPAAPNGFRVVAPVQVALQCTMAVDAGGPDGPVPRVPGKASPTPDARLIQFQIQVP